MESRLADLAYAVDEARKLGARGSEALHERAVGVRMDVQRGKVVDEVALDTSQLTLRCWLDGGRQGEATGTLDQLDAVLARALEAASHAPDDPWDGPIRRSQPIASGLGIDDRRYPAVTREDRIEVVTAAERSVRQVDRRLNADSFRYEDRRSQRTFVNSRRVALEEHDTTYAAFGTVTGAYDGDAVCIDGAIETRTFASIASVPYGTTLARRAAALMQRGERLEGEVLVMMPPVAVARLFGHLACAFTQEQFAQGAFFLCPREDGGPMVDPMLHLVDDGTLPGGFRSRSFDDRGVAPVPLTLLREGRPDGRFLDPRTGRASDARPTGHVHRGVSRPTNLFLRTGTRSINALLTERDTWTFLLDDLPDLSGLNMETGDLVAQVNGLVMKSNEPRGAMRDVRLTGNLRTVLNHLEDLASDTDRYGHVDAPGMLVGGFRLG